MIREAFKGAGYVKFQLVKANSKKICTLVHFNESIPSTCFAFFNTFREPLSEVSEGETIKQFS